MNQQYQLSIKDHLRIKLHSVMTGDLESIHAMLMFLNIRISDLVAATEDLVTYDSDSLNLMIEKI